MNVSKPEQVKTRRFRGNHKRLDKLEARVRELEDRLARMEERSDVQEALTRLEDRVATKVAERIDKLFALDASDNG